MMESTVDFETVADLIEHLHVPPARILLRPSPGDATEKDLLAAKRSCELIDGVLVEKAVGFYESCLAASLIAYLGKYLETNPIGFLTDGTGMLRVDADQVRLPDVSFFHWSHFPDKRLPEVAVLDVLPDLAVEIVSPSNTAQEMERKREEYFAGGTQVVWEVHPRARKVHVYTSPGQMETVTESQELTGGSVLPGFALRLQDWFGTGQAK